MSADVRTASGSDAGSLRPTTVAVVAHNRKSLGGGLPELRTMLASQGITEPLWYEVPKSKQAPRAALKARDEGADLVYVWGGDGTVQQCIDALAGSGITIAILPAGTANLLATNLGIPHDLAAAVDIGLRGDRRTLDLGVLNGEHFAVMAGMGLDALMLKDADRNLKDRVGRLAYLWTGARRASDSGVATRIKVDGTVWFDDDATCVLLGNVGTIVGGIEAFPTASTEDGMLEVGVVTATGRLQWLRALGRAAMGDASRSPFVQTTKAKKVQIRLGKKTVYELDGGARTKVDKLKAKVAPGAITICVPVATPTASPS